MPEAKHNLGRLLRAYRLLGEIEQRALAKDIGVSAATVCRIEQGHHPDAMTMVLLLTWMLKR